MAFGEVFCGVMGAEKPPGGVVRGGHPVLGGVLVHRPTTIEKARDMKNGHGEAATGCR